MVKNINDTIIDIIRVQLNNSSERITLYKDTTHACFLRYNPLHKTLGLECEYEYKNGRYNWSQVFIEGFVGNRFIYRCDFTLKRAILERLQRIIKRYNSIYAKLNLNPILEYNR